jgi:hypothetical protein
MWLVYYRLSCSKRSGSLASNSSHSSLNRSPYSEPTCLTQILGKSTSAFPWVLLFAGRGSANQFGHAPLLLIWVLRVVFGIAAGVHVDDIPGVEAAGQLPRKRTTLSISCTSCVNMHSTQISESRRVSQMLLPRQA